MGEDPDAIRDEIVDTRKRMGETIDALGYKADVKSRTKERVSDAVGTVKQGVGIAQENPLGLAVGALAAGFLVGLVVPSSDVEHEKLGPVADRVKDQARETGQEALARGKEVAQSAAQTVSDEGRKHGEELADSARENAASLRE
jgi:gas vesicle protein